MHFKQIDCFNVSMKFWTLLGIWPGNHNTKCYKYYSIFMVGVFVVAYIFLFTLNFIFVEKNLDIIIGEMIFYFTFTACASKVITYLLLGEDIKKMLVILESDQFQSNMSVGNKIIKNAKKFNWLYWKTYACVSVTCHIAHIFIPVIVHITLSSKLDLPVCSYSFLSEETRERFIYPLYFYQSVGIHICMWYNVNIDTFILGVMIFAIAQLDILDYKLRRITNKENHSAVEQKDLELVYISNFIDCIIHFDEICKYCSLVQRIFSIALFVQFSMSAYIICVCLFRFTMPAPLDYYIFLAAYGTCMILEVMIPCWFGTQIIEKSKTLTQAIYACDWTTRSRSFKSNMRFFVARASIPICITGWKMFPLSLKTFNAIINSAYSAFALLRHMQARQ